MKHLKFITLALLCAPIFFSSCNEEKGTDHKSDANSFMETFNLNIGTILDSKIVAETPKRITAFDSQSNVGNCIPLYVDTQLSDTIMPKNILLNIKSAQDIMNLITEYGLSVSLEDNGTYDSVILLSEEEAHKALKPLINASYDYLINKGLSKFEINMMLQNCNVDEGALIGFVAILAEFELEQEEESNIDPDNNYSSDKAYSPRRINWGKVGGCAFAVLGGDVILEMKNTAVKKWTTALLKKAFKVVAKRYLGVVGAIVAVAEFTLCINDISF